mmetsp:Transcript_10192/g.32272  ORF Transcript_10192/g.32272 Transcript_10192/m.32272 type:complete len:312 (+) Transcript_10192:794-1729(+)
MYCTPFAAATKPRTTPPAKGSITTTGRCLTLRGRGTHQETTFSMRTGSKTEVPLSLEEAGSRCRSPAPSRSSSRPRLESNKSCHSFLRRCHTPCFASSTLNGFAPKRWPSFVGAAARAGIAERVAPRYGDADCGCRRGCGCGGSGAAAGAGGAAGAASSRSTKSHFSMQPDKSTARREPSSLSWRTLSASSRARSAEPQAPPSSSSESSSASLSTRPRSRTRSATLLLKRGQNAVSPIPIASAPPNQPPPSPSAPPKPTPAADGAAADGAGAAAGPASTHGAPPPGVAADGAAAAGVAGSAASPPLLLRPL